MIINNKKKEIKINKRENLVIIIKYKIKKKNTKIRLFGEKFVKTNKDKFEIIVDGKKEK